MSFLAYIAGLAIGAIGGLYVISALLPASREQPQHPQPATTGGTVIAWNAGWRTWTT